MNTRSLSGKCRRPFGGSEPALLRRGARLKIRLVLVICCLAASIIAQPKPRETLFNRLCRMLGINPKLATALTRPRGGGDEIAPHGKRVMIASLDGKKVELLWDCGECWSPAVWRGNITVVRSDGIWRIGRTSAPQRVLAQEKIAMQIGILADRADTMLAMKESNSENSVIYSFFTVDLTNGRTGPGPSDLPADLKQIDIASFPRPDAIRGNEVISTSRSHPLGLLTATVGNDASPPLNTDLPIPQKAGVERFDPVWLNTTTVAFIERDL
jgi:hypothetical protein